MQGKAVHPLRIDREFRDLVFPLRKEGYQALEEILLRDGCQTPISVWNGFILEAFSCYAICLRNTIPFYVSEKGFTYREEAVRWICTRQLRRTDISDEMRRYLIGKLYLSERIVLYRQEEERVRYARQMNRQTIEPARIPSGRSVAGSIADTYSISWNSVVKYGDYARRMDEIRAKCEDVVPLLLSGRYKISCNSLAALSRMHADQIEKAIERMNPQCEDYVRYKNSRRIILPFSGVDGINATQTVKDMPVFDPDAEITALSLTVPFWTSAIVRVRDKTDMQSISDDARHKLVDALEELRTNINSLLTAAQEEEWKI